jgi:hypothetical protein
MPRFGKYYTKTWDYPSEMGVGIELTGIPHDIDAFIHLLHCESCNPVATRRILDDLLRDGSRKTTVMSSLPFDYLGDELAALGVTMTIIEPLEPAWGIVIDSTAWAMSQGHEVSLDNFSEREKEEILKRVEHATESFSQLSHDFGPYGADFDFQAMQKEKFRKMKKYGY